MVETELVGLHLLIDRALSQRKIGAEEELPLMVEPFARRERAVGRSIAVRPLVITGDEYGRRVQRVEIPERLHVKSITADGGRRRARGRTNTPQVRLLNCEAAYWIEKPSGGSPR